MAVLCEKQTRAVRIIGLQIQSFFYLLEYRSLLRCNIEIVVIGNIEPA